MSETTGTPPPPPTAPLPPTTPPPADPFDRIRAFGIARSSQGRWIGGVAAGLARRWNVDTVLVRALFIALTLVGGIGVLLYGLAWALLPEEDGRIHVQQVTRGNVSAGFVGAVALVLLFCIGAGDGGGPFWWNGFPGLVVIGLIIAGVVWYQQDQRKRVAAGMPPRGATEPGAPPVPAGPAQARPYTAAPFGTVTYPPPGTPGGPAGPGMPPRYGPPQPPVPPPPPAKPRARASHRITLVSLGLAVLAAAAVVIVASATGDTGDEGLVATLAMAAALAVMAAGVILAGVLGRKSGGLAPLGILLAIVTIGTGAATSADISDGAHVTLFGDRDWRPASVAQAEREWNLGAGEATLWLTDPALSTGRTSADPLDVRTRIGAGTLTVVLPAGVPAEVSTELGEGEVTRPDGTLIRVRDGDGTRRTTVLSGPAGAPVLKVDVRMGFGSVEIRTGSGNTITPLPAPSAVPAPSVVVPSPATPAAPAPAVTLTPTP